MRLTKLQKEAFTLLTYISECYLNNRRPVITQREHNILDSELGVNLESICFKKSDITAIKGGKNDVYIVKGHAVSSHRDIPKHLHFKFQIKELKSND